jgi:phosphomannomutase
MHLARLAEYFPACRGCAHRDDTGTLSAKLVKRLRAAWSNGRQAAGFTDEGFAGNSPNDLPPIVAGQVAAAFGLWLQRRSANPRIGEEWSSLDVPFSRPLAENSALAGTSCDAGASGNCVPTPERGNEGDEERGNEWSSGEAEPRGQCVPRRSLGTSCDRQVGNLSHDRKCRVAVGHDGRAIMPEYVAAVCEGLRMAACETFDAGPATASSLEFAVAHFQLNGGMLLGSAHERPSSVCLKFWGGGPRRICGDSFVEPMQRVVQGGFDRPARSFAALHRLPADAPFLASLADEFHGLRPLRFVLSSTSRPWIDHLQKLLQPTACEIIPCRVLPAEFASQIVADNAHFGVRVADDGECCDFFDEQGRAFPSSSLSMCSRVPRDTAKHDALEALIALLIVLSRGDRPCSAVLDRGTIED